MTDNMKERMGVPTITCRSDQGAFPKKKRMGIPTLTCQRDFSPKTHHLRALCSTVNEERKMTRTCGRQKKIITDTMKKKGGGLWPGKLKTDVPVLEARYCWILMHSSGKGEKRYEVVKHRRQESGKRLLADSLNSEQNLYTLPAHRLGDSWQLTAHACFSLKSQWGPLTVPVSRQSRNAAW